MISLTPMDLPTVLAQEDYGEVGYLLRRADEETVAAIRATDRRVFNSHAGMAKCYSIRSVAMMSRLDSTTG